MSCEKDRNKNTTQKGVCKVIPKPRIKIIDIAKELELKNALAQFDRWVATNNARIIDVFGIWSRRFELAIAVETSSVKSKIRYEIIGKDRCFTRALARYEQWIKAQKNINIISTAVFSHMFIEIVVFFEDFEEAPKNRAGFI
ncbi:MAG: hypothetical protein COU51_04385 [Parcubacteria group bacterium CG10_big_fil_rev_8_21_14_0_10_36_14]|nr:MAG: hypothetical protein COU51_04385 [Parcubacteria group bacterium CG10_big_fil_rev_8_21_14_0_10_36_14]